MVQYTGVSVIHSQQKYRSLVMESSHLPRNLIKVSLYFATQNVTTITGILHWKNCMDCFFFLMGKHMDQIDPDMALVGLAFMLKRR